VVGGRGEYGAARDLGSAAFLLHYCAGENDLSHFRALALLEPPAAFFGVLAIHGHLTCSCWVKNGNIHIPHKPVPVSTAILVVTQIVHPDHSVRIRVSRDQ